MKNASMVLAAIACAMITIPMTITPADAYTHWSTRWHTNRFGHGCRTSRADRYIGGRHIWRYRRFCR